ncbi:hypothetical protein M787_003125 [Chlamydia gallinacea 08-1274/3]|uniref:Uncharacterized protein n=1 Tax=Chlamydia gallinacea 08-1274/3 TaxID=1143323 RepID=A0A173DZE8_9CHLA|nr:hypothetical protein M787_003125 [Chlamydia gallinacea 08-1274/3]
MIFFFLFFSLAVLHKLQCRIYVFTLSLLGILNAKIFFMDIELIRKFPLSHREIGNRGIMS